MRSLIFRCTAVMVIILATSAPPRIAVAAWSTTIGKRQSYFSRRLLSGNHQLRTASTTTTISSSFSRAYMPSSYRRTAFSRFMSSSEQSSGGGTHIHELIQRQKEVSEKARLKEESAERDFLTRQKQIFDDQAEHFASADAVPEDLVPVLQYIANEALVKALEGRTKVVQSGEGDEEAQPSKLHILDVACGSGALFPFYCKAAEKLGIEIEIVGVDLSPKMVEKARQKSAELTKSSKHAVSIEVVESNIEDYHAEVGFDLVVANACFGNFLNQKSVLSHCSEMINEGGRLFITHPLGQDFVGSLHKESPESVPNLLPARADDFRELTRGLPLRIDDSIQESVTLDGSVRPVYMAGAKRIRARPLGQVIRLRGVVDEGYGRGGKKLGFPTANLPSNLFQHALESVATGVYFGWAVLEGTSKGRNTPHKAVVNVGFSPTFEGQENPEKIVEAHLILEEEALDPGDFYGETMRLQLHGYLRPEVKFPGFPALVAQISADKLDADEALDMDPYSTMRSDPFLTLIDKKWVGSNGGDERASWESEDFQSTLEFCQYRLTLESE